MLPIRIDGHGFSYVPAGAQVPAELAATVTAYRPEHADAVRGHPRLRLVVSEHRLATRTVRLLGALHWADPADPARLDAGPAAGDLDAVLERALVCRIAEPVCHACGAARLVAVPGEGPGASSVRQRVHEVSSFCPTCGDPGFAPHVEVLDA